MKVTEEKEENRKMKEGAGYKHTKLFLLLRNDSDKKIVRKMWGGGGLN